MPDIMMGVKEMQMETLYVQGNTKGQRHTSSYDWWGHVAMVMFTSFMHNIIWVE